MFHALRCSTQNPEAFSGERIKNTSASMSYSPLFYPILPHVSQDKRFHGSFWRFPISASNVPIYGLQMLAGMWSEDFSHFRPEGPWPLHHSEFLELVHDNTPTIPVQTWSLIFCTTCKAGKIQHDRRDVGRGCGGKTQNQDQAFGSRCIA